MSCSLIDQNEAEGSTKDRGVGVACQERYPGAEEQLSCTCGDIESEIKYGTIVSRMMRHIAITFLHGLIFLGTWPLNRLNLR